MEWGPWGEDTKEAEEKAEKAAPAPVGVQIDKEGRRVGEVEKVVMKTEI